MVGHLLDFPPTFKLYGFNNNVIVPKLKVVQAHFAHISCRRIKVCVIYPTVLFFEIKVLGEDLFMWQLF